MAIDWTSSMRQEFDFFDVDQDTWADADRLDRVSSCDVTRDRSTSTLESGSLEVGSQGWLDDERVVRAYLTATQGGESERVCVATLAYQGLRSERDGTTRKHVADGYGVLQDMAQDSPPYGFAVEGDPSEAIALIVSMSCRAPYVGYDGLPSIGRVWAQDGDSWLDFANAVAGRVGCEVTSDPYGRVVLAPSQALVSLRPVWTYGRDNCIVTPHVTYQTDLFGIPNWCEVTVSDGTRTVVGHAENADPASPTSTVRRRHRIPMRLDNPDGLPPTCTQEQADSFAAQALSDASVVTRTWEYTHGWCPARVGDCVVIDLDDEMPTLARVDSQDITLKVGVEVAEVATSTERTWSA